MTYSKCLVWCVTLVLMLGCSNDTPSVNTEGTTSNDSDTPTGSKELAKPKVRHKEKPSSVNATETPDSKQHLAKKSPLPKPPLITPVHWDVPVRLKNMKLADQKKSLEIDLSGVWHGVYYESRKFYRVSMDLQKSKDEANTWSGPVKIYSLKVSRRKPNKTKELWDGSIREGTATATLDVISKTTNITVTDWSKIREGRTGKSTGYIFLGVLATNPDSIGGTKYIVSSVKKPLTPSQLRVGYDFVLTRKGKDSDRVIAIAKRLTNIRSDSISREEISSVVKRGLYEKVIGWTSRFTDEYPDVSLRGTGLGKLAFLAANMFEDEHFKKHFGVRFDDMTDRRSAVIGRAIRNAQLGKMGAELRDKFYDIGSLSHQFDSTGSTSRAVTISRLWSRRVIKKWQNQHLEWLRNVSPYTEIGKDISKIELDLKNRTRMLFPSESRLAEIEIRNAEKRISPAVLDDYVWRLISEADTTSHANIRRLATWRIVVPVNPSYIKKPQFKQLETIVNTKLDSMLSESLNKDLQELSALPDTFASLKKTSDWYTQTLNKYGLAVRRPMFNEALQFAINFRATLLDHHSDEVHKIISEAKTNDELERLVLTLLAVPGDRNTKIGRKIVAAAESRKPALDREAWLSMYSKNERNMIGDGNVLILPKLSLSPPTNEEIRLALLREAASTSFRGRLVDSHNAEFVILFFPPGLTSAVPKGHSMWVRLEIKQVIQDRNVTTSPDATGSYDCRFRVIVDLHMLGELEQGERVLREILAGSYKLDINAAQFTEKFKLTKQGWRCPSLQSRMLLHQTTQSFLSKMFLNKTKKKK